MLDVETYCVILLFAAFLIINVSIHIAEITNKDCTRTKLERVILILGSIISPFLLVALLYLGFTL